MQTFLRFLVLILLPASLSTATLARSPEETLLAYVEAVKKDGMVASVRYMHPGELATFRTEVEPQVVRRLKDARTRQRFSSFADPYNMKQVRAFKDDADFVATFIKWMTLDGKIDVTTLSNAVVVPLGSITEGDLRHVVARFTFTNGDKKSENVTVTSMKMDGAQPMLLLPPELKQVATLAQVAN